MTDTLAQTKSVTAAAPPPAKLLVPKGTHLGPVHLAVTDADRALSVWRDMVGLTVLSRSPQEIVLGPHRRSRLRRLRSTVLSQTAQC